MAQIHDLNNAAPPAPGTYFVTDDGSDTGRVGFNAAGKALLETYQDTELAGERQTVKQAIDQLDEDVDHVREAADSLDAAVALAEGSAQAAAQSAAAAQQSADMAYLHEQQASVDASQAAQRASQAASSAQSASASQAAAQTAKGVAENAALRAEDAADTAEGAKTAAAGSASSAAGSANSAAGSANSAAGSANSAAGSATEAETAEGAAENAAERAEAAALRAEDAAEDAREHASPVLSINGRTGAVVLSKSDLGLGNVDDTSDANKPISTATQEALNGKLDKSGGTLTGNLGMGGNKVTGVGTCTDDSDAAPKAYVDSTSLSERRGINLLDNWYFIGGGSQSSTGHYPINQRANTRYTKSGAGVQRTIDRWCIRNEFTGDVNLYSYALSLSFGYSSSTDPVFAQYVADEVSLIPPGTTLTFSVLRRPTVSSYRFTVGVGLRDANDNVIYSQSECAGKVMSVHTFTIQDGQRLEDVYINALAGHNLIAAKLEIGDHQTLAHQDSNGDWVLNDPPPNFQQELAKCQRYLVVFSGQQWSRFGIATAYTTINATIMLFLPTQMRVTPAITSGPIRFHDGTNTLDVAVTWSGQRIQANVCSADVFLADSSAFSQGRFYNVSLAANTGAVVLSAEL